MNTLQTLVASGFLFAAAGAQAADPTLFAPGVISGPADEMAPAFTPDGKSVYFTRSNGSDYDIMVSHREGEGWSKPVVAPFSGQWRDLEPAMAPDGSYLIFASSRPLPGTRTPPDGVWSNVSHPAKGGNLWRVDRKGDGWGEPVRLPDTVNRSTAVFSPAIAANGDLYFMEASGEGDHFRLYCSRYVRGNYQAPEPLSFTAGQYGGVDAAIAPDESFIVFASNRPPAPQGQGDLFIVFRQDGHWGEPVHLPDSINRLASITEVRLGPDGHTLYFSSGYVVPMQPPKDAVATRRGLEDMEGWNDGDLNIWQVDISDLLKGKPASGH